MRRVRLVVLPAVLLFVAAACGGGGGDEGGGGGGGENTGTVNVLSALEPEEATVLNGIIGDLINPNVDYTAEVEASADFEEQVQIRAEGGTLDIILLPQPGAVVDQAASGTRWP